MYAVVDIDISADARCSSRYGLATASSTRAPASEKTCSVLPMREEQCALHTILESYQVVGGMGNRKPSFSHSSEHRLISLLYANRYLLRHEPRAGRRGTLDVTVLRPTYQILLVVSVCGIPLCPEQ